MTFVGLAALVTAALVAIPVIVPPAGREVAPGLISASSGFASGGESRSSASPASRPADSATPEQRASPAPGSDPRRKVQSIPEAGSGTFFIAPASPAEGHGATRYRVEVEAGLPFGISEVARFVESTLADERGWANRHRLVRVDEHADLRIVLATPATVDKLCAPLDTDGRLSCRNGANVVLNAWRWSHGADSYAGDLTAYRRYVINHETGHALGYPHAGCPGPAEIAPVMLQQTLGLDGCQANPWPSAVDLRNARH